MIVHGKKVGKTSGMILSIKERRQKPRRVPTALHRLFCFSKVRRQPGKKRADGSDGRQAKARY